MAQNTKRDSSPDTIIDLTEIVERGSFASSDDRKGRVDFDSALSDLLDKKSKAISLDDTPELEDLLAGLEDSPRASPRKQSDDEDDNEIPDNSEDLLTDFDAPPMDIPGLEDVDALINKMDVPVNGKSTPDRGGKSSDALSESPVGAHSGAHSTEVDVDELLDSLLETTRVPETPKAVNLEISETDLDDLLNSIELESSGGAPAPMQPATPVKEPKAAHNDEIDLAELADLVENATASKAPEQKTPQGEARPKVVPTGVPDFSGLGEDFLADTLKDMQPDAEVAEGIADSCLDDLGSLFKNLDDAADEATDKVPGNATDTTQAKATPKKSGEPRAEILSLDSVLDLPSPEDEFNALAVDVNTPSTFEEVLDAATAKPQDQGAFGEEDFAGLDDLFATAEKTVAAAEAEVSQETEVTQEAEDIQVTPESAPEKELDATSEVKPELEVSERDLLAPTPALEEPALELEEPLVSVKASLEAEPAAFAAEEKEQSAPMATPPVQAEASQGVPVMAIADPQLIQRIEELEAECARLQEQSEDFEGSFKEQSEKYERLLKEQNEELERSLQEQSEAFDRACKELQDSAERSLQAQRESADRTMKEQRESAERSLQEQRESADRSLQEQRESAERSLQEQRESADRSLQEQCESAERSLQEQRESAESSLKDQRESAESSLKDQRESADRSLKEQRDSADRSLKEQRDSADHSLKEQGEASAAALAGLEQRLAALESGEGTIDSAEVARQVLESLRGDIDKAAAESAARVLREEIANLLGNTE